MKVIETAHDPSFKISNCVKLLRQATNVLGEKSKLQADLHDTQAQLRVKGNAKVRDKEQR